MGSIVLRLLLTSICPTGAVIVGTGDRTTPVEKIQTAFVNGVSKITPNFKSLLLNQLAFRGFDRQVEGTAKNRWISKNYENVVKFNQDPLSGHPCLLYTSDAADDIALV